MAKRELSITLMNLKFMQRAVQREEKAKMEVEPQPDGNLFTSNYVARNKCIVITEGDPNPGAVRGRMSFQNFNPSLDKMVVDAANERQTESPGTSTSASLRENVSSQCNAGSPDGSAELKRKQAEVAVGSKKAQYPNKTPKNGHTAAPSSSLSSSSRKSQKQQKHEKLDWKVLRPPKGYHQQRKG